ncbi:MAG: arsenite methyltransferase [Deltaproteobacteria bacterium]|nr:arsenite methyltransferase [Deltaproteobacteria bacterium]
MDILEKEKIKEKVRESYGNIAKAGGAFPAESNVASCCGPSESSTTTEAGTNCCGSDHTVGKMSSIMGYSKEDVESVPEGANMALGCGNPVALASLKPGETVVDLGSGGGFDCFLAAKEVGETGQVIGVDMTSDMIHKARLNAEKMRPANVDFRLGEIEYLPVADNTADIIMSNCVINLSPDKESVYRDAFRVLKPGGRLSISDIVATASLPEKIQKDLELVSACVGGAATIDDTRKIMEVIGFEDIRIVPNDHSRDLIRKWDPNHSENAVDYIVSASIEAVKPG